MKWLQCGIIEEYAAGIRRLVYHHSYIYKLISLQEEEKASKQCVNRWNECVKSDSNIELLKMKCTGVWRITFQRYGSIIFFLIVIVKWSQKKEMDWVYTPTDCQSKAGGAWCCISWKRNDVMYYSCAVYQRG